MFLVPVELVPGYASSEVKQNELHASVQPSLGGKNSRLVAEMIERIKETLSTKMKMSANELSASTEPKEMFLPWTYSFLKSERTQWLETNGHCAEGFRNEMWWHKDTDSDTAITDLHCPSQEGLNKSLS